MQSSSTNPIKLLTQAQCDKREPHITLQKLFKIWQSGLCEIIHLSGPRYFRTEVFSNNKMSKTDQVLLNQIFQQNNLRSINHDRFLPLSILFWSPFLISESVELEKYSQIFAITLSSHNDGPPYLSHKTWEIQLLHFQFLISWCNLRQTSSFLKTILDRVYNFTQ